MQIEKAINFFENLRVENMAMLAEFKKEIEKGKTLWSYNVRTYEDRNKYYLLAIQALKERQHNKELHWNFIRMLDVSESDSTGNK